MSSDLSILFADRHLIAVNKPARTPVASDASGDDTLLEQVRLWNEARQVDGRKGYCVPIHFLDRPVSGLVLFGLSSKGAARLNEQFRSRSLQKTYLAVVCGRPSRAEGRLEHDLAKDKHQNLTRISHAKDPEAKRSILTYRVLGYHDELTLLEVRPETGRSHQIRVQLASLGTPIWGDVKYGAPETWNACIALHAWRLELSHPVGKETLCLEAPLPEYWASLWPHSVPLQV
ncbi:MAG: RluA family pseudouridine synthase [Oligoflexus sp.]